MEDLFVDLDKLEHDTNNFVHDASYVERVNILINLARKWLPGITEGEHNELRKRHRNKNTEEQASKD